MNVKVGKLAFKETEIPDVKLLIPTSYMDKRGEFMETYNMQDYYNVNIYDKFAQDNLSYSVKNVLRGLHYQHFRPQSKLVSVIKGTILDVAVDIRKDSPTFKKYVAYRLSDANKHRLYIPHGFAHGFLVLSDEAIVAYKCDGYRVAGDEYGIRWNDPDINIDWGLNGVEPIMSDKDANATLLKDAKLF